ncbi:MAG: MFS transporter [Magnetovibrio sp.]|nr:MFS transporter [Magnetovibrio sp.]
MSETTRPPTIVLDDPDGTPPDAPARGRERWVVGLIGAGHFLSHYYALALPPLFPILKAEFGVSYLELGLAMTAYSLLGGLLQAPVGFLVDHLGPRRVLLAGLGLNAAAVLCMGFADAYWVLLVLAVLAGLGNSVFHPADYAILSGSIDGTRLGRAFSAHTFAGFLGGACAPVGMLALAQWSDWRTALIAAGLVGLAVFAAMAVKRGVLRGEGGAAPSPAETADAPGAAMPSGVSLLMSAPVLLFLAFFIVYGMASGGLTAFTVSALVDLHGLGLDAANAALTGYLFGIVGGILLGGVIADRFPRHLLSASVALLVVAAAVLPPALLDLPGIALIGLMVLTGVGMGAVLPPRDLMIRAFTPAGQTGKVFGFIFVGYSIGGSTAPVLMGWLLDAGQPAWVFILSAVFALMSILTVAAAQRLARRWAASAGAAAE